jgi:hypothetical protein
MPDWAAEQSRARSALERNRRLIEASAVEEARQYRPTKSAPAYKPKQKKKRRRGRRKRPIAASRLPEVCGSPERSLQRGGDAEAIAQVEKLLGSGTPVVRKS